MLQDQDVATAIKTLIAILKRQTVQVFKLESDMCSLTEHQHMQEAWKQRTVVNLKEAQVNITELMATLG